MPERISWAVTKSATEGLLGVEDARVALGALLAPDNSPVTTRTGIRPAPGNPGRVTASTPTADRRVSVAPFQLIMRSTRSIGPYVQTLDAPKVFDILGTAPAHTTNTRIDLIVAQQSDTYYQDTESRFTVRHVVGAASVTPSDPRVDGSPDVVVLARIRIPPNAQAITDGMIDNEVRPPYVAALGGIVPVRGLVERAALTASAYPGLTLYRHDKGWYETWDGAAWRVPGGAATWAAADITDPYIGQVVILRSDNMLYRWTGAQWLGIAHTSPTDNGHGRYIATSPQPIPNGANTKLSLPVTKRSTGDVERVGSTDFVIRRAGVWTLAAAIIWNETLAGGQRYITIADATNAEIRYTGSGAFLTAGGFASLSCSDSAAFAVGDRVSVMLYQDNRDGLSLPTAPAYDAVHLSLTWLRP